MLEKLKTDFDEIIALVSKTPAPLQEMAFKMILEQWFSANITTKRTAETPATPAAGGLDAAQGGVPDAI